MCPALTRSTQGSKTSITHRKAAQNIKKTTTSHRKSAGAPPYAQRAYPAATNPVVISECEIVNHNVRFSRAK